MTRALRPGRGFGSSGSGSSRAGSRPRWVLVALVLALVVGLLACGPAHAALHSIVSGDAHADADGSTCTGCSLSSLEMPSSVCLFRPALRAVEFAQLPPIHVPASPPLLTHSPRGPPARA